MQRFITFLGLVCISAGRADELTDGNGNTEQTRQRFALGSPTCTPDQRTMRVAKFRRQVLFKTGLPGPRIIHLRLPAPRSNVNPLLRSAGQQCAMPASVWRCQRRRGRQVFGGMGRLYRLAARLSGHTIWHLTSGCWEKSRRATCVETGFLLSSSRMIHENPLKRINI